jgi:hypothetical protein
MMQTATERSYSITHQLKTWKMTQASYHNLNRKNSSQHQHKISSICLLNLTLQVVGTNLHSKMEGVLSP